MGAENEVDDEARDVRMRLFSCSLIADKATLPRSTWPARTLQYST